MTGKRLFSIHPLGLAWAAVAVIGMFGAISGDNIESMVGQFFTSIVAMVSAYFAYRAHAVVERNAKEIVAIRHQTNSMHEKLVAVARSTALIEGHALGHAKGIADERRDVAEAKEAMRCKYVDPAAASLKEHDRPT
jgi:hypothetical protein